MWNVRIEKKIIIEIREKICAPFPVKLRSLRFSLMCRIIHFSEGYVLVTKVGWPMIPCKNMVQWYCGKSILEIVYILCGRDWFSVRGLFEWFSCELKLRKLSDSLSKGRSWKVFTYSNSDKECRFSVCFIWPPFLSLKRSGERWKRYCNMLFFTCL